MTEFIPLEELRHRIWPMASAKKMATDMTGISLPILDFHAEDPSHPYKVVFLLYYAVPDTENIKAPPNISRSYAWIAVDLKSGEFMKTENIMSEEEPKPLVGPGARKEVVDLEDTDRRNLQNLFFSRCDEAARIYFSGSISPDQADHLDDLQNLYSHLMEPPLEADYEKIGKSFFTWLRLNAKSAAPHD